MKRFSELILKLMAIGFLFTSCLDDDNPNEFANEQLQVVMDQYYFWYNQMPSVKPKNYSTPLELLEALRYKPLDKWSYITTKQQLQAYFEEGSYIGFGFGTAFDQNGTLWILYTFKNSPVSAAAVERGWRIASIDGVMPTPENISTLFGPAQADFSRTFEFRGPNNQSVVRTLTKQQVTMNMVLKDSIYTFGTTRVGYFVLKGFIQPSKDEMNAVFTKFQGQGVSELIVDLRYNGGGRMDVANHLAGLIAGRIANNQILTKLINNNKNQHLNSSDTIKLKSNSIALNRVVFITTQSSASASESLINGLKPYMDVKLAGSKTHGKPVGMYSFTSNAFDWAFVPICFELTNALNQGQYFNGIPVDHPAADDFTTKFGETSEASLNTALASLGFTVSPKKETGLQAIYHTKKGLEQEIDAW